MVGARRLLVPNEDSHLSLVEGLGGLVPNEDEAVPISPEPERQPGGEATPSEIVTETYDEDSLPLTLKHLASEDVEALASEATPREMVSETYDEDSLILALKHLPAAARQAGPGREMTGPDLPAAADHDCHLLRRHLPAAADHDCHLLRRHLTRRHLMTHNLTTRRVHSGEPSKPPPDASAVRYIVTCKTLSEERDCDRWLQRI